ncbi:MAG: DUF4399 domain-containing protein [Gemmatimonadetes bacterium]|nr:DUF4399 domain-containing protein [Gemmatimonadota bacterium]
MRNRKLTWRSGRPLGLTASLLAFVVMAACGGGEQAGGEAEQMPAASPASQPAAAPSVTIVSPAENDEVDTETVNVVLSATGIRIVPSTVREPGTGHHHLFIDTPVSPPDSVIPSGLAGIVHLGRAQTEFTVQGLQPGTHQIIAVVADADHVPIQPLIVDTVRFVMVRR